MRNRSTQNVPDDEGFVLVLALWAVLAAALGAAAIIAIGQVQQKIVRNDAEALREDLALQSGIYIALHGLLNRPSDWVEDGRVRDVSVGLSRVDVSVADEAGKIDINAAGEDLLMALFAPVALGDERKRSIVAAIQDWRDRDDNRRLLGSENADYAAAGYKYEPRNRPFANPGELQRVAGMTAAAYRQAAPAVTVYSQKPGVDSRVAIRDVLRRLPGMDATAVNGILRARQADGDSGEGKTFVGRTISIQATLPGKAEAARGAVVRLFRRPSEQVRIMAWQSVVARN